MTAEEVLEGAREGGVGDAMQFLYRCIYEMIRRGSPEIVRVAELLRPDYPTSVLCAFLTILGMKKRDLGEAYGRLYRRIYEAVRARHGDDADAILVGFWP